LILGSGDDAGSKSPDANDFDEEDGNGNFFKLKIHIYIYIFQNFRILKHFYLFFKGITIDATKEPGVKFSSLVEDEK
jgi:hypothetical protein